MAQFITHTSIADGLRPSVVFFGMGSVSLASLKLLVQHTDIEAVITKSDSTQSRSKQETVSEWAKSAQLPVFEVNTTKDVLGLFDEKAFSSPAGLVIDFGIIIPKTIIDMFPKGILNSHFSLLPELRGADPITFSILNKLKKTGVSIMQIQPTLDTGDILATKNVPIEPKDTAETLTAKLVDASDNLLQEVLPLFVRGEWSEIQEQDESKATYSHKLSKQDGEIDWSKSADTIEHEVRAYQPWPGSFTVIDGQRVTITEATVTNEQPHPAAQPGTFFILDKNLAVVCGQNSSLIIEKLKPAGKQAMTSQAFLAGRQSFVKTLSTT